MPKKTTKKTKGKKKAKPTGPKLTAKQKNMLKLRKKMGKKRPNFSRQEWYRYKRLGNAWRKPRGLHSKKRKGMRYRGKKVKVGFRGPTLVRGYHPSGYREVIIHNPRDLEALNSKEEAAKVGAGVGIRKRLDIEEKAKKIGIKVLNPLPKEEEKDDDDDDEEEVEK